MRSHSALTGTRHHTRTIPGITRMFFFKERSCFNRGYNTRRQPCRSLCNKTVDLTPAPLLGPRLPLRSRQHLQHAKQLPPRQLLRGMRWPAPILLPRSRCRAAPAAAASSRAEPATENKAPRARSPSTRRSSPHPSSRGLSGTCHRRAPRRSAPPACLASARTSPPLRAPVGVPPLRPHTLSRHRHVAYDSAILLHCILLATLSTRYQVECYTVW